MPSEIVLHKVVSDRQQEQSADDCMPDPVICEEFEKLSKSLSKQMTCKGFQRERQLQGVNQNEQHGFHEAERIVAKFTGMEIDYMSDSFFCFFSGGNYIS